MSHHSLAFLLVFLGGGLGSMLRHAVNQASAAQFGVDFAWGTLIVNIVGSFAMGLLAGWFALRGEGEQMLRLFLATGIQSSADWDPNRRSTTTARSSKFIDGESRMVATPGSSSTASI
jgi:hypothetical protein